MSGIVVIGGGHNGLITATLLAKAGRQVTILEQSDQVGGCARTTELAPGFRCPTLAHVAALDPALMAALALARHGLEILRPDVDAYAPSPDGPGVTLWRDAARTADGLRARSRRDAERYPAFLASFSHISAVMREICSMPPPSIDRPGAPDLVAVLKAGRRFRALAKPDAYRLLRWVPMAVGDLASEWFEGELLQATVAGGGILGNLLGPRSAGTGAALLLLGASEGHPIANGWYAKGGIGAIADALAAAAREAGVSIRTNAEVVEIQIADGQVAGVTLTSGEQIAATAVVSNADPKRTFSLVDPIHLSPEFILRLRNWRARGALAKVNFAVSTLPAFNCPSPALTGRIRLAGSLDAIERAFDAAKYGRISETPWIELTIPSLLDPSLAPAGAHVVSAYVQYAPYHLRGAHWDIERERMGRIATETIAVYAPGFHSSIVAREVITPVDLERTYGLTGGHVFHGELALDQLFVMRPVFGWARYRTPVRNLFLCGSGTHPGTGLNGRSGALAAKAILSST